MGDVGVFLCRNGKYIHKNVSKRINKYKKNIPGPKRRVASFGPP
jgi:hypothetical protein